MKFSLLLTAVTYLLVLAGMGSIYFSGEIALGYSVLIGLLFAASLLLSLDYNHKTTVILWNAAVIIAFLYFVAAGFRDGNWLLNAINFSLFMVVAKLFQRRNARDYYQIYALSFLQIIGSAVINPGISFGVIFFIYLMLLTPGLILLTILRDYEEAAVASGEQAAPAAIFGRRDIIRPNVLMLTSAMAVVVFILSLFIFFSFPRLGLGFFTVKVRKGVNITGFSDRIELGGFGTIKDDPEVVMRVVIRRGAHLAGSALRMRGMALDYYDGRQWFNTVERRRELIFDNDGNMRVDLSVAPLELERVIEQEIYLEPLNSDTKVLFAMPVLTAIKRIQSAMDIIKTYRIGFYRDYSHNVTFSGPANMSLSYTAFSYPEERDPEKLRNSEGDYNDLIKKYYLQLPLVDKSVIKLAGEITKGAETPYDKAEKVEKYLASNFRYSLNSAHPPDDPVKDFLIANREGHCEYFASAMVILLRISGVPARIVNGFYGGEFNSYGNYYAIRNGDAHSWVEVYLNGHGWVTFDPTPPTAFPGLEKETLWKAIENFIDAMKLKWYKWIIEYDLEKQIGIARGLFLLFSGQGAGGFDDRFSMKEFKHLRRTLKGISAWKIMLYAVLFFLLISAYLLLRRKRFKSEMGRGNFSAAARLYRRFLKKCAGSGYEKLPHETPYEFLKRLERGGAAIYPDAKKITEFYVKAAFSGDRISEREMKEHLALIKKRL